MLSAVLRITRINWAINNVCIDGNECFVGNSLCHMFKRKTDWNCTVMKVQLNQRMKYGIALLVLVCCAVLGSLIYQISNTEDLRSRVVQLRVPTALSSMSMLNGINESLASLRGYMILNQNAKMQEKA